MSAKLNVRYLVKKPQLFDSKWSKTLRKSEKPTFWTNDLLTQNPSDAGAAPSLRKRSNPASFPLNILKAIAD